MTRSQYLILNGTALVLVALFAAHFFAARSTNNLGAEVGRQRAAIGNAVQLEAIQNQLIQRIAKGAETDPRLRALLPVQAQAALPAAGSTAAPAKK